MGEIQGCPRDIADLAGAEGDVLECPPSPGEQGKAAFAQAAKGSLQSVARAVADIEFAAGGLADRNVDADTCTLMAGLPPWLIDVGRLRVLRVATRGR
jgi:hypothetical protein